MKIFSQVKKAIQRDPLNIQYREDRRSLKIYHRKQIQILKRQRKAAKLRKRALDEEERVQKTKEKAEHSVEPGSAADMEIFMNRFRSN